MGQVADDGGEAERVVDAPNDVDVPTVHNDVERELAGDATAPCWSACLRNQRYGRDLDSGPGPDQDDMGSCGRLAW